MKSIKNELLKQSMKSDEDKNNPLAKYSTSELKKELRRRKSEW
jgi:hypothetical protein